MDSYNQENFTYIGNELDLFSKVIHWKSYFKQHISHYIKGDVLEVGAGKGATTAVFSDDAWNSWTCLEPDEKLLNEIQEFIQKPERKYQLIAGSIAIMDPLLKYDAILYIDVLEHIEDDRAELMKMQKHLKKNGYLIVLSPAHQSLFSPFDANVGHFRRYDKASLSHIAPPDMACEKLIYLDSVGALLSASNRLLLRHATPSASQLAFWDNIIIPFSKVFDRLFGYRIGKSILGIWKQLS